MSTLLPASASELALVCASSGADTTPIESWLSALGLEIARLGDPVEILARVDRDRPAIVVVMETPGDELASALLGSLRPRERDLSVIVVASGWNEALARQAWGAGAAAYIDLTRGPREAMEGVRQTRAAVHERNERRCADALATLGLAAGGIVHDLNNALTAILGNVELMREMAETDLGAEVAHHWVRCFDSIDEVSTRVALLAKQLVFLGRAPVPRAASVAPRDALLRLRVALRSARFGNVNTEVVFRDEHPGFRVDLDALVDVLSMLVFSAREVFGGPMTVRLEAREETVSPSDGALAVALPPGRYSVIVIHFLGSELHEVALDRLFEPKSLHRSAHHRNVLTFPAAFALVRRLGGHLLVHRRVEGMAFRVYFPALEDSTEVLNKAA